MDGKVLENPQRKTMKFTGLLLLVICIGAMAATSSAALKPGVPAPEFAITTTNGDTVSLSDFLGQIVILHFWKSN